MILKWRITPGITKIVITPEGGAAVDSTVSAAEVAAGAKTFKGLTPETKYKAEIFAGTKPMGFIEFTTKELSLYTVTLTPGQSLFDAVNAAANAAKDAANKAGDAAKDAANKVADAANKAGDAAKDAANKAANAANQK